MFRVTKLVVVAGVPRLVRVGVWHRTPDLRVPRGFDGDQCVRIGFYELDAHSVAELAQNPGLSTKF